MATRLLMALMMMAAPSMAGETVTPPTSTEREPCQWMLDQGIDAVQLYYEECPQCFEECGDEEREPAVEVDPPISSGDKVGQ